MNFFFKHSFKVQSYKIQQERKFKEIKKTKQAGKRGSNKHKRTVYTEI